MRSWADEIRQELDSAQRARAEGNEGRARVCARRAGGVAAREYLGQRGEDVTGRSAYQLLQRLAAAEDAPELARRCASLLTLRVDEGFSLPAEVDLLREARELCRELHPSVEL
jgi:hypothetical protein